MVQRTPAHDPRLTIIACLVFLTYQHTATQTPLWFAFRKCNVNVLRLFTMLIIWLLKPCWQRRTRNKHQTNHHQHHHHQIPRQPTIHDVSQITAQFPMHFRAFHAVSTARVQITPHTQWTHSLTVDMWWIYAYASYMAIMLALGSICCRRALKDFILLPSRIYEAHDDNLIVFAWWVVASLHVQY